MIPKISVIMTVYNCEKYLPSAIESILSQTFSNFEFIICNDGSTDNSVDVIRSYKDKRIRFYDSKLNMRIPKRRNEAIRKARSDLIAIQDGDDVSFSDRLEMQYRAMYTHEDDLFCIGGHANKIDVDGNPLGEVMDYPPCEHEDCVDMIRRKCMNPMIDPTVMFRKSDFDKMGGYTSNNDIYTVPDFDLWVRAIQSNKKIANLNMPVIDYRENPEGMTANKKTEMIRAHMIVWNKLRRARFSRN